MFKVKMMLLLTFILSCIPFIYYSDIEYLPATRMTQTVYQKSMDISGVIESEDPASITLSYPVFIKDCYVSENSYVNKGQLMFTLDTDKMQTALGNYNISGSNSTDINGLKKQLIEISPEIYATENGIVRDIAARSGSIIMSGERLCVIEKGDKSILKISLNQQDYPRITVGDIVVFSPVTAPARKYTGKISDKTAVVHKETILTGSKTIIDIFAEIDYADDFISNGIQFTGTVYSTEKSIINTLPYEYIGQDDNGEYIYKYKNGKTEKIYIETGIELADTVEIKTVFPLETVFVRENYKGKLIIEHLD